MEVKVINQEKKIFEGKAQKVYAKTKKGDVEILDEHAKFVGVLSEGGKIKIDDKEEIEVGKALVFTDGSSLYIFVE